MRTTEWTIQSGRMRHFVVPLTIARKPMSAARVGPPHRRLFGRMPCTARGLSRTTMTESISAGMCLVDRTSRPEPICIGRSRSASARAELLLTPPCLSHSSWTRCPPSLPPAQAELLLTPTQTTLARLSRIAFALSEIAVSNCRKPGPRPARRRNGSAPVLLSRGTRPSPVQPLGPWELHQPVGAHVFKLTSSGYKLLRRSSIPARWFWPGPTRPLISTSQVMTA
jgi:hypothetical protein